MYPNLNLPVAQLKLSKVGESYFVFDEWRKKKLLLTPEEWVRQNLLHFLVNDLKYPKNLIASEQGIQVASMTRRCDALVYGKDGRPKMIVECKAPTIKLTEATFMQIAQYNSVLNVDFLLVSNGLEHIIARINRVSNKIDYLIEFPTYDQLNG
jgi:hypothetical protein